MEERSGVSPSSSSAGEGSTTECQSRLRQLEALLEAQAEELAILRVQEARLAEAERIAGLGSYEWDIVRDRLTWSPGLYRLFGVDPERFDATYRGFMALVHPDDRQEVEQWVQGLLAGRAGPEHTHRIRRMDGAVRTVRGRGEVVRNGLGRPVKLQGVCHDVTEEIEAEEARELARIKDHFISSISHEMKTPLSLVIGYAELLQDRHPDCELLRGIQDGARRLATLVGNIVDLGALLSGSLTLYKTEVVLEEAAQHAIASLAVPCAQKDVRVEVALAPDIPAICADFRRVVQMLGELLDNAVKFSPLGATVRLTGYRVGDRVRLEVADSGPGIEKAALSRIFEAFHQEEVGAAMRKGGVGIGLAIVKLLAELHGGHVEVQSRPGHGSRFAIVLPVGTPGC